MLEVVRGPDLRDVLDGGQAGSHNTENVGPDIKLGLGDSADDSCDDQHAEAMEENQGRNEKNLSPTRLVATQFLPRYGCLVIAKEDKKQYEAIA